MALRAATLAVCVRRGVARAAWSGKQKFSSLRLLAAGVSVPHEEKALSGGEDAWFADARLDALGVADGVGGSKTKEVDPGVFSRRLLAFCRAGLALGLAPEAALEEARRCVKRDALASAGGSSTALVATLRGEELRVANFGDSGLLLLRPCPRRFSQKRLVLWPRVVLRSHEQTHYFNCPYQAAAQDAVLDARSVGAAAADVLAAVVRPGDLIVAATDGLWDNVDDAAVQNIVAERVAALWAAAARHGGLEKALATLSKDPVAHEPPLEALAEIAAAIAAEACANSRTPESETMETPFQRAAYAEGLDFQGGKHDDVTVVVAIVLDAPASLSAFDEAPRDNFGVFALAPDDDVSET